MKVGLIISWTLVQHCSGYSETKESSSLITLRGDSFRLSCRHGDGNAQAASAATGALVSPGSGGSSGPSFLSASEPGARRGGLRRVLRSTLPQVLSREVRTPVAGPRDVLSGDADRLLRGDRERTGHLGSKASGSGSTRTVLTLPI